MNTNFFTFYVHAEERDTLDKFTRRVLELTGGVMVGAPVVWFFAGDGGFPGTLPMVPLGVWCTPETRDILEAELVALLDLAGGAKVH